MRTPAHKGSSQGREPSTSRREVSWAFLKAQRTETAIQQWGKEIIKQCRGKRAFQLPAEGRRPGILQDLAGHLRRLDPVFPSSLFEENAWMGIF